MAKAVYRPGELEVLDAKINLAPPTDYPELSHLVSTADDLEEIPEEVVEYAGPTADDLRLEAEQFRTQWETEKEAMINSAKAEADRIVKQAEDAAFKEVKRRTDEAQVLKQQAQDEAENIIADANAKARQIEDDSRAAFEAERKAAEDQGREQGHEDGFSEGKAEVERLVERVQTMLERAQDKRSEILEETEQEIIDLVLLIARKVIKVISENQRNVIIQNVVQALRKV
jgi:flagellar assembly protein FliH